MKFSKNELTATLKKTFEGIGFGVGDYEDAAAMVTWLEAHGLQGLRQIHTALPYLMERPHPQLEIVQDDENLSILDARGGSTLILGKTWVRSVPTGGTPELEVKASGKLAVENYCEAYHLPCHLISIRQHIHFWRFA